MKTMSENDKNKHMNSIIIITPPNDCWAKGYHISQGQTKQSINQTTVYAKKHNIIPQQQRLQESFLALKSTLTMTGYNVIELPFPSLLDTKSGLHHDGVFIRDVGCMYQDKWIQANFNASNRQIEAEVYSKIIQNTFDKTILTLPDDAFLEFGEVHYLETAQGKYYFGGLSRANKQGHDFFAEMICPNHYCLIESKSFHLDTVCTPVLNKDNVLIAIILAVDMVSKKSALALQKLNIDIIIIDNKDSADEDGLGNYAVNCLVGKGFLISGARFSTSQVEQTLEQMGIIHYIVPLVDYAFAGGSVHCLTTEIMY